MDETPTVRIPERADEKAWSIEGKFNPRTDLIQNPIMRGEQHLTIDYTIKGLPGWGIAFPNMPLADTHKKEILFGYFHEHNGKRAYLQSAPRDGKITPVPCYLCDQAILLEWSKS